MPRFCPRRFDSQGIHQFLNCRLLAMLLLWLVDNDQTFSTSVCQTGLLLGCWGGLPNLWIHAVCSATYSWFAIRDGYAQAVARQVYMCVCSSHGKVDHLSTTWEVRLCLCLQRTLGALCADLILRKQYVTRSLLMRSMHGEAITSTDVPFVTGELHTRVAFTLACVMMYLWRRSSSPLFSWDVEFPMKLNQSQGGSFLTYIRIYKNALNPMELQSTK